MFKRPTREDNQDTTPKNTKHVVWCFPSKVKPELIVEATIEQSKSILRYVHEGIFTVPINYMTVDIAELSTKNNGVYWLLNRRSKVGNSVEEDHIEPITGIYLEYTFVSGDDVLEVYRLDSQARFKSAGFSTNAHPFCEVIDGNQVEVQPKELIKWIPPTKNV